MKENPQEPMAYFLMADIYYALGDISEARKSLDRARELAPDDPKGKKMLDRPDVWYSGPVFECS